ncbi:TetR/AcrR family transcriptional regulator [Sphingomonas daechungensis]|uniref:TetR/AcrR family transcriptional regulator n=1 Tax=Sphingomonas daechungensis TaxID=1176646 RepID=A0ABX6T890_9SPHN|nr:TetR/AcrR family transcriptional regulator [Sphingomonas daechungensis]QNP43893.1 TetR/AcrR family transcriptional regulator [Sphingomonas daechungensis]
MNKPEVISEGTGPCRGRPREFCVDRALAQALRVFWEKGYDGTSLTDLTEAMGITRPSLYAAFGNKDALFRKALDLYETEKLAYIRQALEQPTARGVAEVMLRGSVDNVMAYDEPHGCMGVITSVACGPDSQSVREDVVKRGEAAKRALMERFDRAKQEGDLPSHVDSEGLMRVLIAMLQGISVQASQGATRDELDRLVESGLALWPSA